MPILSYESAHPYSNSVDHMENVVIFGTIAFTVSFGSNTSTEEGYDFVTFCKDATCAENWGTYSGTNFPGVSGIPIIMIPSEEFVVRFVSDSSSTDWGYDMMITPIGKGNVHDIFISFSSM